MTRWRRSARSPIGGRTGKTMSVTGTLYDNPMAGDEACKVRLLSESAEAWGRERIEQLLKDAGDRDVCVLANLEAGAHNL
jgi:hypothetical protein